MNMYAPHYNPDALKPLEWQEKARRESREAALALDQEPWFTKAIAQSHAAPSSSSQTFLAWAARARVAAARARDELHAEDSSLSLTIWVCFAIAVVAAMFASSTLDIPSLAVWFIALMLLWPVLILASAIASAFLWRGRGRDYFGEAREHIQRASWGAVAVLAEAGESFSIPCGAWGIWHVSDPRFLPGFPLAPLAVAVTFSDAARDLAPTAVASATKAMRTMFSERIDLSAPAEVRDDIRNFELRRIRTLLGPELAEQVLQSE